MAYVLRWFSQNLSNDATFVADLTGNIFKKHKGYQVGDTFTMSIKKILEKKLKKNLKKWKKRKKIPFKTVLFKLSFATKRDFVAQIVHLATSTAGVHQMRLLHRHLLYY